MRACPRTHMRERVPERMRHACLPALAALGCMHLRACKAIGSDTVRASGGGMCAPLPGLLRAALLLHSTQDDAISSSHQMKAPKIEGSLGKRSNRFARVAAVWVQRGCGIPRIAATVRWSI